METPLKSNESVLTIIEDGREKIIGKIQSWSITPLTNTPKIKAIDFSKDRSISGRCKLSFKSRKLFDFLEINGLYINHKKIYKLQGQKLREKKRLTFLRNKLLGLIKDKINTLKKG